MTHVYELVDNTSEEQYFTLGIWSTFEEALHNIDMIRKPSDTGTPNEYDYEGIFKLELRYRKLGWGDSGKVVYRKSFAEVYKEATDEYVWIEDIKIDLKGELEKWAK